MLEDDNVLEEALAARDPDRIEAAAERYAHTSSGLDAFEWAGDLAWDRNALWRAIGDWSRALQLRADVARRARLEAKIIVALERAGPHTRAPAPHTCPRPPAAPTRFCRPSAI